MAASARPRSVAWRCNAARSGPSPTISARTGAPRSLSCLVASSRVPMPSYEVRVEHHPDDVLAGIDSQFLAQGTGIRQRPEELRRDRVRHDEHPGGGNAAGHDLLAHGLAERHHQVGGQHAPGLQGTVLEVQLAVRELRRRPGGGKARCPPRIRAPRTPPAGRTARAAPARSWRWRSCSRRAGRRGLIRSVSSPARASPRSALLERGHQGREQAVVRGRRRPSPAACRRSGPGSPGTRTWSPRAGSSPAARWARTDLVRPDRVASAGGRQGVGNQMRCARRGRRGLRGPYFPVPTDGGRASRTARSAARVSRSGGPGGRGSRRGRRWRR